MGGPGPAPAGGGRGGGGGGGGPRGGGGEGAPRGERAGGIEPAEGRLPEGALARLELEDALLHGLARHEAVHEDGARLSDAVRAVRGLVLDGGGTPGVQEEDMIPGGE